METPYTVPEIARLTGIPETTLYDYVRQFSGIVPEADSAEENGRPRRRYPEQAIAVFQTIRHLKDRGVDLPTIRALLQEERTPESRAADPAPADTLELPRDAASALSEPTTLTEQETETETAPEATTITATVAEETAPATDESPVTESAAATEEVKETEAALTLADEPILRGLVPDYPFFEVPAVSPAPVVSVSVEPVTPLEPKVIVESEHVPAHTATRNGTNGATPAPVVDGEIVALQGQLLVGLEESLRSLRALINTQNGENGRLSGELKEQRDENERLRATIRYQKDQTRSAERVLAAIKSQCEEGIQSIGE